MPDSCRVDRWSGHSANDSLGLRLRVRYWLARPVSPNKGPGGLRVPGAMHFYDALLSYVHRTSGLSSRGGASPGASCSLAVWRLPPAGRCCTSGGSRHP
eukprot:72750-Chlamydomonas_euryale.AAC.5